MVFVVLLVILLVLVTVLVFFLLLIVLLLLLRRGRFARVHRRLRPRLHTVSALLRRRLLQLPQLLTILLFGLLLLRYLLLVVTLLLINARLVPSSCRPGNGIAGRPTSRTGADSCCCGC